MWLETQPHFPVLSCISFQQPRASGSWCHLSGNGLLSYCLFGHSQQVYDNFVLHRVHWHLMCLMFVEDINKMCIFCKTPENVMVLGLHYSKFSDVKLWYLGPCHHSMAHFQVVDGGMVSKYGAELQIFWVSSHRQPTKGDPPAWGLGKARTTPHHKNLWHYKHFTSPQTWNVAHMGEGRGTYGILVGKPEGKKPLWRPRPR